MKKSRAAYRHPYLRHIVALAVAVVCLGLWVNTPATHSDATTSAGRVAWARLSSSAAIPSALVSELHNEISQLRAECASSWSGHMIGSDACAWDITNLILVIDQDKTYVAAHSDVGRALTALANDLTMYSARLVTGSAPVPAQVMSDAQRVQAADNAALTS